MPEPLARLYLTMPADGDAAALDVALATGAVACVLFRTPHEDAAAKAVLKALVGRVQAQGAAALVEGDTRTAGHVAADGVHVTGAGDDLDQALRSMKPARIVGCGGLSLRDDAMAAGEGGVDYVMFGDDADESFVDRLDRVSWWTEIFEVPCVAFAQAPEEVEPLAETGAEFVALGDWLWHDPRGTAAAMEDAVTALRAGNAAFLVRTAEPAR